MPLFKRSRPAPCPASRDAPVSLILFNNSYYLRTSSAPPLHLLHLTKNIASNLPEAHRLLTLKSSLLHPQDLEWINSVITEIEAALHDIALLIRPAKVARRAAILEIPPLFFHHNNHNNAKSTWLLEDSPHVRALHSRLSTLHGSLMSVLSILYLSDLRWPFVAAEPEPPQYNDRKTSPPPPAYDSIAVEKPLEKTTKQQHQHIWNAPQTFRIPTTPARCAIDNPYTWQPPPTSPPLGGEGKLQHSRSDPTPHPQHPAYEEGFRHRVYKHENISSEYLRGCRLTKPWTVEFAGGDEEGEGESGASIRDDGNSDGLELPPRLTDSVRRRWSSDVLRGRGL